MRKLLLVAVVMNFAVSAAAAQTVDSTSAKADFLSLDQKVRIAEIITKRTPPLGNVNFPIAVDGIVPAGIQLHSLPSDAEAIAPRLHDFSYIVVEELIALVDQGTRKIVVVFPRWSQQ